MRLRRAPATCLSLSTHHGFLKEFPFIRVDAFDGDARDVNPFSDNAAHFHLLTHAHTDHIVGLDSPHFAGEVYCTPVTKHILLQTMEAAERVRYDELDEVQRKRKFANLWRREAGSARAGKNGKAARSLIKEIQINVPTQIQGPQGSVTVTAFDANHCPGSCMFLIEGDGKAVLITGDIRAEPWWVDALRRNPLVAKYLHLPIDSQDCEPNTTLRWPKLDCLYLDNSYAHVNEEFVPKEEAVTELIRFIRMYPDDARFFLNSWTWGYEDMLKSVAKAFDTKIHFDNYKQRMYTHETIRASDPLLSEVGTENPSPHRFHACERRWKCDEVWCNGLGCYEFADEYLHLLRGPKKLKVPRLGGREKEDGKVVYVNPIAMPRHRWEVYKAKLEHTLRNSRVATMPERGQGLDCSPPNYLIVPLARHSPLPELQAFVALFRPRTLYPLTIDDASPVPCSSYLSLSIQFSSCLSKSSMAQLDAEARAYAHAARGRPVVGSAPDLEEDPCFAIGERERTKTCLLNVEGGDDIENIIHAWATSSRPLADGERPRKRRKREKEAIGSSSSAVPKSSGVCRSPTVVPPSPQTFQPLPSIPSAPPTSLFYPSSSLAEPTPFVSTPFFPSPSLCASTSGKEASKPRPHSYPELAENHCCSSSLSSHRHQASVPSRKTVSFVSPSRSILASSQDRSNPASSPELWCPSDTSLVGHPTPSLAPAPAQPAARKRVVTARPSSATRDIRHRLIRAYTKELELVGKL